MKNYAYDENPEMNEFALGRMEIEDDDCAAPFFGPQRGLRLPRCFLNDLNYKSCPPDLAAALIPYAFGRRDGRRVRFPPPPFIWIAEILQSFDKLLAEENITYVDLIHLSPWEVDWYGNFAFKFFHKQLKPIRPLFFHFTLDEHLAAAREAGVSHETLAPNFFGISLAARHQWDHQL